MQVPRRWRLRKQSYSLLGETCPRCKANLFPPRAVCPYCVSGTKEVNLYTEQQAALPLAQQMQLTHTQQ